jgi:hypothetical protein
MDRDASLLVVALLVTSVIAPVATARPPASGTDDNGLDKNESATLWSRDADAFVNDTEFQRRYGDERTLTGALANGTDITFKRPPATAATWTRNDFEDLQPGSSDTSVYPSHANLTDGTFIQDAHATVFSVHPSTRGHLTSGETPLYVAPDGTLRGFVDYRVRIPEGDNSGATTAQWSLTNSKIEEVRLTNETGVIASTGGSHTPTLDYNLTGNRNTTLALEAEISVRLKEVRRTDHGTHTSTDVTYHTERRNVSDSIDVEVYNLTAYPSYAEYPNGDRGIAMFQTRPWQGYTLTEDGNVSVRGVWRFYTARDTDWDTLVKTNGSADVTIESDALPVYVHAYPSRIGPRTEPVRDGPEILDVWGPTRPTPAGTIGDNVNVEVVNQSYTTSYGLAARAEQVDRESVHVAGIVRGVNATVNQPEAEADRQIRESELTVEVLEQNENQTTVRIELRDNETGAPIALEENDSRVQPIGDRVRAGYISIADQRVRTNASGVATVTLDQPGIYTARYHPGSWLGHNPAYASDTATIRWHPLRTIDGWFALIFEVGWQFISFFVMFYAGRRLLRMLGPEDIFQQNP